MKRTSRAVTSRTADQLSDALRTERHLAHAHAEGRERVLDGLGHECRHRNRARLAHALDAQWIERRQGLEMHNLDGRYLRRRRDVELHERAGEWLAGSVVAQLLVERAPDPLRHTAVDLALHDGWVHDAATVVLNDVLEEAHDAGLDVNLDNGGVATAREGRL